ncbi:hypothetical protein CEY11_17990 [Candidimonas nitroreducens]|uniref:Uncharacterized protein n=1 Tax=Candidimonas nitroreducens TaxID=683354 RepID=A0A225M6P4_9BURK|nr:hypothetical protein CEY11_17990 [Candidimonas nitroreducens]
MALCLPLCASLYSSAGAVTVHSLDQVRGAIKSPEGRATFDQQINGAPLPDGFGTQLPQGFTKEMLLAQLAPGQDPKRLTLAGAKPWPQQPQAYVAIVCLATSPDQAKAELRYDPSSCSGDDITPHDVWLGVYTRDPQGKPRLVARTEAPVDTPVDWGDTNIDTPQSIGNNPQTGAAEGVPQNWLRFDFAAYRLHGQDYAFGVRAGWSEGYAGGGATFEALYLFQMDDTKLHVVFAQPMMYTKMLAGEWHKDGTRDHIETDASNVLSVLKGTSHGFHDLRLQQRSGKWHRVFRWSAKQQRYAVVKNS